MAWAVVTGRLPEESGCSPFSSRESCWGSVDRLAHRRAGRGTGSRAKQGSRRWRRTSARPRPSPRAAGATFLAAAVALALRNRRRPFLAAGVTSVVLSVGMLVLGIQTGAEGERWSTGDRRWFAAARHRPEGWSRAGGADLRRGRRGGGRLTPTSGGGSATVPPGREDHAPNAVAGAAARRRACWRTCERGRLRPDHLRRPGGRRDRRTLVPRDVGVRGDRDRRSGEPLAKASTKRRVDAAGKYVAPGSSTCSDSPSSTSWWNNRVESKIRQGITTEVTARAASVAR
jgi:hypothetical protein